MPVEVLPGPAAFVCAAVLSGFPLRGFRFAGFAPRSANARRAAFRHALGETTVWYEAPHRLRHSLADLAAVAPNRRVFLVRELSKRYEQQVLGTAAEVAAALDEPVRGEVVLVVEGAGARAGCRATTRTAPRMPAQQPTRRSTRCLAEGLSTSAIAKRLVDAGHGKRRFLYARVGERRDALARG